MVSQKVNKQPDRRTDRETYTRTDKLTYRLNLTVHHLSCPNNDTVTAELLTGDGGVWVGVTVTVEGGAQALAVSPAIHSYSFSIAPVTMEEKIHGFFCRISAVTLERTGLHMFHSEILASLSFNKNKMLSPGLENKLTLKCCFGNFPT